MSVVHTFKSGKQVIMENGVTKIVKPGKGQTGGGGVQSDATTFVGGPAGGAPNKATPLGQAQSGIKTKGKPVSFAPPSNVAVKNQFNIVGGTIGQMAIGNQGSTTFNQKTEVYQAGAQKTDINIKDGNFAQANIGGTATYNNKDSLIGGEAPGVGDVKGNGLSVGDLMYSDGVVERKVLEILEKGMSAENFMAVLRKGLKIEEIYASVSKHERVPDTLVKSMLRYDATEEI